VRDSLVASTSFQDWKKNSLFLRWLSLNLFIKVARILISRKKCQIKKVKQSHNMPRRRLGERRYRSNWFMTSALDGGGHRHSPAALCSGERTPVPIEQEAGWGPRAGLDIEVRGKILCPCRGWNPDRPVAQSVVRHYTDWITAAPEVWKCYR
jgi:hypothetical protein